MGPAKADRSQSILVLVKVRVLKEKELTEYFILHKSSFKAGFCPGERIEFQVSVNNQSNRQVKPMAVELYQQLTFRATNKTNQEKRSVTSIKYFKSVNENTNEVWSDGALVLKNF